MAYFHGVVEGASAGDLHHGSTADYWAGVLGVVEASRRELTDSLELGATGMGAAVEVDMTSVEAAQPTMVPVEVPATRY